MPLLPPAGNAQLQLRAAVRPEQLKLGAKLEALLIPLRPVSAELAPLQVTCDGNIMNFHARLHRAVRRAKKASHGMKCDPPIVPSPHHPHHFWNMQTS